MGKKYQEQRASKKYIVLVQEYALRAKRRELGIPIGSKVPIPNRPRPNNLLKIIFSN